MKKIKLNVLLIVISVLTLVLFSCKKDKEEGVVIPLTKTELITQSMWRGVEVELYKEGVIDNTVDLSYKKYEFFINGILNIYSNNTLESTTTWAFKDNETVVDILEEGSHVLWVIEKLDANSFIISIEFIEISEGETLVHYKEVDTYIR